MVKKILLLLLKNKRSTIADLYSSLPARFLALFGVHSLEAFELVFILCPTKCISLFLWFAQDYKSLLEDLHLFKEELKHE